VVYKLRNTIAAVAISIGIFTSSISAEPGPPSPSLSPSELTLVGAWEGDLLSDLAHAWPNGDFVPPEQRSIEIIELRTDRTVVIYPRCVERYDGIVNYLNAYKLRWLVTSDQVLHWYSDSVGADLLTGTVPPSVNGNTFRLINKRGNGIVFERYAGKIPPLGCQYRPG
jgi:hypothetical protein